MDKKLTVRIVRPDGQARTLQQKDPDKKADKPIVRIGQKAVSPEPEVVRTPAPAPDKKADIPAVITDKDYEQLVIRQGELYRQRSKLSNQLVDIAFDSTLEERQVIVNQILARVSEYNSLAEKKRFFEKHGKWPEIPPEKRKIPSDTEKKELLRQINNLRSNISKAKKAIEKYQHQPAKVHKYQQKKARLEIELQYAEELIRS